MSETMSMQGLTLFMHLSQIQPMPAAGRKRKTRSTAKTDKPPGKNPKKRLTADESKESKDEEKNDCGLVRLPSPGTRFRTHEVRDDGTMLTVPEMLKITKIQENFILSNEIVRAGLESYWEKTRKAEKPLLLGKWMQDTKASGNYRMWVNPGETTLPNITTFKAANDSRAFQDHDPTIFEADLVNSADPKAAGAQASIRPVSKESAKEVPMIDQLCVFPCMCLPCVLYVGVGCHRGQQQQVRRTFSHNSASLRRGRPGSSGLVQRQCSCLLGAFPGIVQRRR
jgi:hypothetical protein